MRTRLPLPFVLLVAALALSACAPGAEPSPSVLPTGTPTAEPTPSEPPSAYPLTLTDDAGREVTLPAEPERIVSLAPSNTEIVCALGHCDRIVGVPDYREGYPDDVLAAIADVPDVVVFAQVDVEKVVAADPDLVLAAGNELTPTPIIEQLDGLGLPVIVLYPESLDEIYADIELVGAALDLGATAEQLTGSMRDRVAQVTAAVADEPRPRTFYEVSVFEGTIYTAGEGSFLASLIDLAGGEPVTGDALSTSIELEELVAADPELVLLGDATYDPSITPESVAARPGWGELSAVRDGRVVAVEDDILITRPGPRIVDGLVALARAIHPDAFD